MAEFLFFLVGGIVMAVGFLLRALLKPLIFAPLLVVGLLIWGLYEGGVLAPYGADPNHPVTTISDQ